MPTATIDAAQPTTPQSDASPVATTTEIAEPREFTHETMSSYVDGDKLFLSPDGRRLAVYRDTFKLSNEQRDRIAEKLDSSDDKKWEEALRDIQRIARESGKSSIMIEDGKLSAPFRWFGSAQFSANSQHFIYSFRDERQERSRDGSTISFVTDEQIVLDGKLLPKRYSTTGGSELSDLQLSPDGTTWSAILQKGRHQMVLINGREDQYVSGRVPVLFQPNGHDYAFRYFQGTKYYIRHNSRSFGPYAQVDPPIFSKNGKRFGFVGRKDDPTNRVFVVTLDGVEVFSHTDLISLLQFSDDGAHYSFILDRRVYLDGTPLRASGRSPVFSPDGRRLAYTLYGKNRKPRVVVDDKEWPACEDIPHLPVFSPDSRHLACVGFVRRDKKRRPMVILDGKSQKVYEEIRNLQFTPDSRTVSYLAKQKGEWFLVMDGQEHPIPNSFPPRVVKFSPDGSRAAVILHDRDADTVAIYVDEGLLPAFRRANYGHWEGDPYPDVQFSPDGQHLFCLATVGKDKVTVVRDAVPGQAYDRIVPSQTQQWLWFDEGEAHVVAIRGNRVVRMREKL